jgi:hypothetical protein
MAEAGAELVTFLDRKAVVLYAELTRADSKCNTLLGLSSAGLALLVVFANGGVRLPIASKVLVLLAVLCVGSAILVLLRLLRPRTIAGRVYGAVGQSSAEFLKTMHGLATPDPAGWRSEHVQDLARLVWLRMRQFRLATDLLVAAIALVLPVPIIGLFG